MTLHSRLTFRYFLWRPKPMASVCVAVQSRSTAVGRDASSCSFSSTPCKRRSNPLLPPPPMPMSMPMPPPPLMPCTSDVDRAIRASTQEETSFPPTTTPGTPSAGSDLTVTTDKLEDVSSSPALFSAALVVAVSSSADRFSGSTLTLETSTEAALGSGVLSGTSCFVGVSPGGCVGGAGQGGLSGR